MKKLAISANSCARDSMGGTSPRNGGQVNEPVSALGRPDAVVVQGKHRGVGNAVALRPALSPHGAPSASFEQTDLERSCHCGLDRNLAPRRATRPAGPTAGQERAFPSCRGKSAIRTVAWLVGVSMATSQWPRSSNREGVRAPTKSGSLFSASKRREWERAGDGLRYFCERRSTPHIKYDAKLAGDIE